jgi:H+/Cl- antiporter ClcA
MLVVAAGFGAPITGVFYALECGNRCLARNTVQLAEGPSDAPRADIAGIVLAATMASVVARLFLQQRETLLLQGDTYAMTSPFFELPVYLGLALLAGGISVVFEILKDRFTDMYAHSRVPRQWRPLFGGLACGCVAVGTYHTYCFNLFLVL